MNLWRRTLTHARGCTVMLYGWRRTLTQDIADAKLYVTYRCCHWAQLRCHQAAH